MKETGCLSCGIVNDIRIPLGERIITTRYFNAHQDVAYPIPGLVILASNRHFCDLDEMTEEESKEFIELLKCVRSGQRQALGIKKVYYFYNEDTTHHFHFWMVPRLKWMNEFGRSVESLRPILIHARTQMNNAENIQHVVDAVYKLRAWLSK